MESAPGPSKSHFARTSELFARTRGLAADERFSLDLEKYLKRLVD